MHQRSSIHPLITSTCTYLLLRGASAAAVAAALIFLNSNLARRLKRRFCSFFVRIYIGMVFCKFVNEFYMNTMNSNSFGLDQERYVFAFTKLLDSYF